LETEDLTSEAEQIEPAREAKTSNGPIDVAWSPANVGQHGSAAEAYPEKLIRYHLFPTWRSQLMNLSLFLVTSIITIVGSNWEPEVTVLRGRLFAIGDTTFYLHLPWLIFLPGFLLGKVLIRVYDSEYIIDGRGIEAKIGLVSLMLRQPRMRFEDIRGVEPSQTIWERILGIGHLEIGSAMKDEVEITMEGIANPRAVQLFISGEIERSLRRITQSTGNASAVLATKGD